MNKKSGYLLLTVISIIIIGIAACNGESIVEPTSTAEEAIDTEPETIATPELVIPFLEAWKSSGHADRTAEAFIHWNDEDDPVVPASCAKCHSSYGYQDFLGLDGSEVGVVDQDAALGSVVSCETCHNEATLVMDSVLMPSGVEIVDLGDEARCMQCHQGRSSTVSVDNTIAELGIEDEDKVNEELGFTNIHYYAAAATKYGTVAQGGYQYENKVYDSYFSHVENYETCIDCHDSHTLEVKVDQCETCHGFSVVEDYRDARMAGSEVDYDGDGIVSEGIYYEIQGFQEMLYQAIQAYASGVAGTSVVYDSHSYPYFFNDTDADGEADENEINYGNKYASWTPRLLKAAYNYQLSQKDPGAYAHGGKYIIQLLYDSIEDLDVGVDLSNARRIDPGHFAGSEEAFRHWDEDGAVPSGCSRCHSAGGLPLYLTEGGVAISQPISNGLKCSTCHNDLDEYTRYEISSVTFPSGAQISDEDQTVMLCMNCHQGRSSTNSVDQAIAGLGRNEVSESLRFINIHYFAAGATLYGSEAAGGYQFSGKTYVGRYEHVPKADSCAECHDAHVLEVEVELCSTCHDVESADDLYTIRADKDEVDYDGDGTIEGMAVEIEGFSALLYQAIQDYAARYSVPIIYESHTYPYFFIDSDGNGEVDPGEAIYPNSYAGWTPSLLQAAYNYQYSQKDQGAFAHNAKYILQILYDSIRAVGGDVGGLTRP